MKKDIKQDGDLISEEKRKAMIVKIIKLFKEEEGQDIGIIKAKDILNFYLELLVIDIYNKGIEDTKNIISTHFMDLEVDIDILIK